jgi:hypothetical protein
LKGFHTEVEEQIGGHKVDHQVDQAHAREEEAALAQTGIAAQSFEGNLKFAINKFAE